MAVALLALFLALGGGAYAAQQLAKNSVGSKQIKKGAVTNAKLGKNAVTGNKVKNGSLTGADINLATLPKVGSAGTADNANHATNADSATNAGHATNADSATNAGHATNADKATNSDQLGGVAANRYITNTSTLASGQTETGIFGGNANAASGYVVIPISFIPKVAPFDLSSNAHIIAYPSTSGTNCPGAGQADPGHLCVYEGWRTGVTTDCVGGTAACGSTTSDPTGVNLYYNATTGAANVTGTWAYTAP
jgi:hypothetical protein